MSTIAPFAVPREDDQAATAIHVVGLFAGIGGLEVGVHPIGARIELLCEIDPDAQRVLEAHFPDVSLTPDIRELRSLPTVDLITAGFPCQDLSMAGRKIGIRGEKSGLVDHLFRLLSMSESIHARWLLLENVPYMLHLDRGRAMKHLTTALEDLGYTWAYRVVDARAFGIPQRRLRVVMLASRTEDPRSVLFADDVAHPPVDDTIGPVDEHIAYGFYWTEGLRGLGWAVDGVPTIKGGSTLGIASPPAIWIPETGVIGTPDIRDLERLQGFPEDWTAPAQVRKGARWQLVGQAVCIPVAQWVGERLASPGVFDEARSRLLTTTRWPLAAWGYSGSTFQVDVSTWPVRYEYQHLRDFLRFPLKPLSARAASGFYNRALISKLNFADGFLEAVSDHIKRMSETTDPPNS